MCHDASSPESWDESAAFSARSLVRSEFAESSARLSWRTATFTNTTPARRIPLTTIQRIPPRARTCCNFARGRPRGAGWVLGRLTGSATTDCCACGQLANLRRHPQARRLRARVACDLCSGRPNGAPRRRAELRLAATDAHGEIGRAGAAVLLRA